MLDKESVMKFKDRIVNKENTLTDEMTTLQVNLGNKCNMKCSHCHVEAGGSASDEMSKEVMEACLESFKNGSFEVIDITGGAPEMNSNFDWFLDEACKISDKVIVRTNLTVLQLEKYHHLMEKYRDNKVEIVASLPCYTKENTDKQRGNGAFDDSIKTIKELNSLGYGKDDSLVLNFVYNPLGAFLPGCQEALEKDYKRMLEGNYGIIFNNLLTITNNPVGRFKKFLDSEGEFSNYMELLESSYNEVTEENLMCRYQVSVGFDGSLYDCDFNQALGLPIESRLSIFDIREGSSDTRNIVFANHCYACTAGQGSSCGGAIE